jgi:phospholipid/cholesterol/gamma-HCH transport system permease protein
MSGKRSKFRDYVELVGARYLEYRADMREMVEFLGEVAQICWKTLRGKGKIRWGDTFYYMDLCGAQALAIVTLICLLMGLIMGFQGAVILRTYGAELFIVDMVGFVILKEMGPLMVAMIATGRAGSAFAAEIGTMKVNEEVNALATMGIEPLRILVLPKLLAMLVTIPLLTVFGDICGILGGFVVGTGLMDIPPVAYYSRTVEVLTASTFMIGIVKSIVFAVIITLVGCIRGFQSSTDAQGVGRATTSSVVTSIFLIVIADAIMTILCYLLGY